MLRRFTFLVAATFVANACGPDGTPTTERDADVYAVVIRALAAEEPVDPTTTDDELESVVYAGPLDEENGISLEVQAAVVEQLEDVGTIRFIDQRTQAIDEDEEGEPVVEDGMLVLLGDVPAGSSPSVDAERYVDLDDTTQFVVTAERSRGEWAVVSLVEAGTG